MSIKKVIVFIIFNLIIFLPAFSQSRVVQEEKVERTIRTPRKKADYLKTYPDLTVSLKAEEKGNVKSTSNLEKLSVLIKNTGKHEAKNFIIDFILSTDQNIPVRYATYSADFKEDLLLDGGRELIKSLKPGETIEISLQLPVRTPDNTPVGNQYIGVVVDSKDAVKEINEKNNTLFFKINLQGSTRIKEVTQTGVWNSESGNIELIIKGTGFGKIQGKKEVQLGPFTLDIEIWSDNLVVASIPPDLKIPFGQNYEVFFSTDAAVSNKYRILLKIDFDGCFYQTQNSNEYEMEAAAGSILELQGGGFGTDQRDIDIIFGTRIVSAISWSDEQIRFKCPHLPPGEYLVYLAKHGICLTITKTTFKILP